MKVLTDDFTKRLSQFEANISSLEEQSNNNEIQELRDELTEGLRILGKRVTKAIQDMEDRFSEFKEQVDDRIIEEANNAKDELDSEFGAIRESAVLDPNELEVIVNRPGIADGFIVISLPHPPHLALNEGHELARKLVKDNIYQFELQFNQIANLHIRY